LRGAYGTLGWGRLWIGFFRSDNSPEKRHDNTVQIRGGTGGNRDTRAGLALLLKVFDVLLTDIPLDTDMILYTNREYSSPYALSVYAALCEKGLPFELRTIDLSAGENRGQAYRQLSLTSRIPTLAVDDFSLSESSAIIEYLEDAYTPPEFPAVFPEDIRLRARARQLQAWVRSDLAALRAERPTSVIYGLKRPQALSAAAQQAADKLLAVATNLDRREQRPFVWRMVNRRRRFFSDAQPAVCQWRPVPRKVQTLCRTSISPALRAKLVGVCAATILNIAPRSREGIVPGLRAAWPGRQCALLAAGTPVW